MRKQKHHYVQEKYIAQWHNPDNHNQLSVYNHETGEIKESGAKSKSFWEKDFNILASSKEYYYLPEKVSSEIDDKGITVIREINESNKTDLTNIERSTLAIYTALQYLRTPRYRKETDELLNATLGRPFGEHVRSQGGIKMSKFDVFNEKPQNEEEKKMMKEVAGMTDEEFEASLPTTEDIDNMRMGLNTEGHSKFILKAPKLGEKIYDFQWTFLLAPEGTNFVTSDNPCFTASRDPEREFSGLCSDYAVTIFPLSPTILLYIDNSKKSHREHFYIAPKKIVKNLNKLIIANSYDCVVAKDKSHLENLLKNYKHRKNKTAVVRDIDDYSLITLE